jgi:hypothetical protein
MAAIHRHGAMRAVVGDRKAGDATRGAKHDYHVCPGLVAYTDDRGAVVADQP